MEFIIIEFSPFSCSFRSLMSRYSSQHNINAEKTKRRLFVRRATDTNLYRDIYFQPLRAHLYRTVYLDQRATEILGSSSLPVSPEPRLLSVPKLFHDSRQGFSYTNSTL
jgi:hypothetical protein